MAIGERVSILPTYRGTTVLPEMMELNLPFIEDHDVRVGLRLL